VVYDVPTRLYGEACQLQNNFWLPFFSIGASSEARGKRCSRSSIPLGCLEPVR